MALEVDYPELEAVLKKAGSENVILDLVMKSSKGSEKRKTMIKELQMDAISQKPIHADFYEISMDQEITVNVPINLINTPIGVTNGGIQQLVRREIPISCLPDNLVDKIDLDVADLDIGDAYHISDIELPEGVRTDLEEHLTVVTVAAPTMEREVEEEELEEGLEEAAEPSTSDAEAEPEE